MRLLHLTPYYAPAYEYGGVVRAVEGMAQALVGRGHSVTVLTTNTGAESAPSDETLNGVRVVRAPNIIRRRANLSTPQGMKRLALDLLPNIDLVHCHEFRTVENLIVMPLAAQKGIPLVMSPHGTLTYNTGRSKAKALWDKLLSPAVAQRFDHIIALTQAEADEAQALWPTFGRRRIPTGFSVVPNGVNVSEFANLDGREAFRARYGLGDGVVCLFMGRLHPRKGVDILAQAFRSLDIADAKLLIVGPDEGMLAALTPLLDERVIVTGYLGGAERLAAFAAADLLALPAVGEGLPMAVLEALAAGLPVLISPGCNLPEVATSGAGLIVEPQAEPLAVALRTLLTNANLRSEMGTAARRLANERFSWDAAAAQLESVYRSLIGRP